jgi:putative ABC transport system permease protein
MPSGRWRRALRARLAALFRGRRTEQDLDDELAFHIAMQARAHEQRGMSATEARRQARLALGGVEQVKERSRDVRPVRWAHDVARDVRHGLRSLWNTPRFTVAALVTVILGVGANATIFSVLNPLLFKPLPYPEPDRIVDVFRTSPQSQRWPHSVANYLDQRERNHVFEHLTAFSPADASLVEGNAPAERVFTILASGNLFAMLGVAPAIGRTFTDADDRPGADPVAVLSHRFWQQRLAGDPRIVGRALRIDGRAVTVIGVMPDAFEAPLFWGNVDLWRPFAYPAERLQDRGNNFLIELGRLKAGVSLAQADAAMKTVVAQIYAEHTTLDARESVRVTPITLVDDATRRVSGFAFGLTFFVLLIACVNLANLQLARTSTRAREFAIRGAIGGGRARLLRQSMTESLLLSLIGGLLAIPLSYWCTRWIAMLQFSELAGVQVTMDAACLGFAFLCAVVTGVVFGAVPAWMAARTDINDVLRQHPRSASCGGTHRFRHALIVAEIAFALVTLAGAASFIRGLQLIGGLQTGWRPDGLSSARISLIGPAYPDGPRRVEFYERLQGQVANLPGITHVSISNSSIPVRPFNSNSTFRQEGRTDTFLAYDESITPEYFDTLGIPLRRGRMFTSADRRDRPPVAIINESMARALWPHEDAIGKRFTPDDPTPTWVEVVGVVGDVRFPAATSSSIDTEYQIYIPLAVGAPAVASIIVRTAAPSESIAANLTRVVAGLDRDVAVVGLTTARAFEARTTASLRLLANVLGGFAALGLILATIGIFGVVSYSTAQRTGELGMRMALGARQSEVLWLVLRQGVALTLAGTVAGLIGGLGLARLLAAIMPRLPSPETLLVVTIAVGMTLIALLAMFIPARRASKISPMIALRHES